MIELVLDASVVLKWFAVGEESAEAHALRAEYEAGRLRVTVPSLLFQEVLNVAGRRWRWPAAALLDLAESLVSLVFEVAEPDPMSIAVWVGRGLTAYDAAYVALAERRGHPLVTDDRSILALAPGIARPLADA